MENPYFKKEKILKKYSYKKRLLKGNQLTNILKTYNNINNEIIINIKNNEKYSTDADKKYEVRKIRLKLPNELIQKKETFDFLDLNLRNTNNSRNSNKQIIPNSIIYKQNIENKKYRLGRLINDLSLKNKYDTSINTNNTFQYTETNPINIINNTESNTSIKKVKKEGNQILLNKVKVNYYKKPIYSFGNIVYHKINNLSYNKKTKSTNNTNTISNKKIILENIKQPPIYKINPIMNLPSRNHKENYIKKNPMKKSNTNIINNKIHYRKIKPKEIKVNSRDSLAPINVNRRKQFYSNNESTRKDDEFNNNSNNINDSRVINKTSNNTFNRKSFRFLVKQTNKNNELSTSFSKCYHNNSRKRPLLQSSQTFSFNDSMSFTNTYNETESNNESTFNNNETNVKRRTKYYTQKTLQNNDKNNFILINDETNRKKIDENISRKKYILNYLNTPKYRLIYRGSKLNTLFSSNTLTSQNSDYKKNLRNISAISLSGINLDLYYLEEKFKLVVDKIRNYEKCSKECYDYIKYFFDHNFYNELLKPFKSEENIKQMKNYIKIEILCFFLCYDVSLSDTFKITEILLKSIFEIIFHNFMLYLCLIVSQSENKTDNIIIVLNKIIKDNLKDINHDHHNMNENKYINTFSNNSKSIIDYYNIIINNIYNINRNTNLESNNKDFPDCVFNMLDTNNNNDDNNKISEEQRKAIISIFFTEIIKSIDKYNIEFFQQFFEYILCFDNNEKELNNIDIIQEKSIDNINYKNKDIKYFLPPIQENKEYSLILDLEDTLIHSHRDFNFKKRLNLCNINKKIITFRPDLFKFLQEMKPLFELILFSSNTPEYVDPIVNSIQKEEKYFDYILYRRHITLDDEGNNVKNLELIGRDLKKVIIVDDISRYFNLQKENGINIKPFYGNGKRDGNTLQVLGEVLKKIRKDVEESNDIRISLKKFRNLLFPDVVDKLEEI